VPERGASPVLPDERRATRSSGVFPATGRLLRPDRRGQLVLGHAASGLDAALLGVLAHALPPFTSAPSTGYTTFSSTAAWWSAQCTGPRLPTKTPGGSVLLKQLLDLAVIVHRHLDRIRHGASLAMTQCPVPDAARLDAPAPRSGRREASSADGRRIGWGRSYPFCTVCPHPVAGDRGGPR
jgi:hypothetical protein